MTSKKNPFAPLFLLGILLLTPSVVCGAPVAPNVADLADAEVRTSSAIGALRVAPGELLPIAVKLLNFGNQKKVDVTITYQILDQEKKMIVTETETVAVETTASFIKNIQIPRDLPPGNYSATSEILYSGQVVPATSLLQFSVERKIAGVFASQFYLYIGITLFIALLFGVVSRILIKRRQSRLAFHDYSNIPKPERMYYEMISDTIMQMHNSQGDKVYEMAASIEGLTLNKDNGKVIAIAADKDYAEIMTILMIKYETTFGKKSDLKTKTRTGEKPEELKGIDKNTEIINTYFRH